MSQQNSIQPQTLGFNWHLIRSAFHEAAHTLVASSRVTAQASSIHEALTAIGHLY